MFAKLFAFAILLSSFASYAQSSVDELFSSGLKSYQSGKFEDAENQFEQALTQQPNNASLLYNLGLAEYKSGKTGPAIASWRKALTLDPSLADARDAISFATNKLEHRELPHQVMLLESLRTSYLQWVSLNQLLFIFALTFFAFGWALIRYLGSRKTALENEAPPPSLSFKIIILLTLFLGLGLLSAAKFIDVVTPRATVLPKTVAVRAGPDNDQAALFDLYEGLEVLVDDVQNNWMKITYPGGRSGWIPSETVSVTK